MPIVIVTGYEPWGRASENPTLDVLNGLEALSWNDADLRTLQFPVDTSQISRIVDKALDEHRPDVWISLGLAPGASRIAIERIAANVLDYQISDNAGNEPQQKQVFVGAPLAYAATIPVYAISDAIRQRGIPVKISNSAGTYACNQLMYTALHMIEMKKLGTRGGFIHIPHTPGYVAKQNDAYHEVPSMNLDLMVDAVTTAITVSLRRDAGIKAAFGAG
jgi:pyroglutamyl-peptidase